MKYEVKEEDKKQKKHRKQQPNKYLQDFGAIEQPIDCDGDIPQDKEEKPEAEKVHEPPKVNVSVQQKSDSSDFDSPIS